MINTVHRKYVAAAVYDHTRILIPETRTTGVDLRIFLSRPGTRSGWTLGIQNTYDSELASPILAIKSYSPISQHHNGRPGEKARTPWPGVQDHIVHCNILLADLIAHDAIRVAKEPWFAAAFYGRYVVTRLSPSQQRSAHRDRRSRIVLVLCSIQDLPIYRVEGPMVDRDLGLWVGLARDSIQFQLGGAALVDTVTIVALIQDVDVDFEAAYPPTAKCRCGRSDHLREKATPRHRTTAIRVGATESESAYGAVRTSAPVAQRPLIMTREPFAPAARLLCAHACCHPVYFQHQWMLEPSTLFEME
ncbi:hypothetical protein EVG20_g2589 [Dentipellis fragilis]|uniref:Uncharacterized protein n=1 Tax=Dentipellis fragilis TaxID=205917 RepID=A0A4Y9Z7B7_9AGAM|nr:hypothetical protein EVG20_g2589 [Dentipellis fragilis]